MASKYYPRQAGTTEHSFKIGVGQGKFSQTIDASGLTADQVWVVPNNAGGYGYSLQTDGAGNLSWALPGASTDKTTPYNILPTETYTVAVNKQALYAENIDVNGNLVVEGDLIDTRSPDSGGGGTITLTGNVTGTGSGTINTTIPALAVNNTSGYPDAIASGTNSLAIGYVATASNDRASAIGTGSTATGQYSTAVGFNSGGYGQGSTGIGYSARGGADQSTAIGNNAYASGDTSLSIGWNSHSAGNGSSSAIGAFAATYGTGSTALSGSTATYGASSLAAGQGCVTQSTAQKSMSSGWGTVATCPGAFTFAAHENANAKTLVANLAQKTTDATPKSMYICQAYNYTSGDGLYLEDNCTYIFSMQFVGTNNTDYYAAKYDIVVSKLSGTTTIRGTPLKTVITQTSGASAWDIGYTTSGGFNFTVTGDTSSTCYWTAAMTAASIQTV